MDWLNKLIPANPWLKTLVEIVFFVVVGIGLSLFLANSPSLDDVIRGAVISIILGSFSMASSKISELRTKANERAKSAKFMEQVAEDLTVRSDPVVASHELRERAKLIKPDAKAVN